MRHIVYCILAGLFLSQAVWWLPVAYDREEMIHYRRTIDSRNKGLIEQWPEAELDEAERIFWEGVQAERDRRESDERDASGGAGDQYQRPGDSTVSDLRR